MSSNLRFPKVFVLNSIADLIVDDTPTGDTLALDLTLGQVGVLNAKTRVGVTAIPTHLTAPVIEIHQNVGDSNFGTVRTKPISAQKVKAFYAKKNRAATNQITYIGYKETGSDTIAANCGEQFVVTVTVYENDLVRWYGPRGYSHRIVIDTGCCADPLNPTAVSAELLADAIVAEVNNTNAPAGSFPTTHELSNYITATKVTDATNYGVKLTAKALSQDALNSCDPQQFFKAKLITFDVSVTVDECKTNIAVSKTQNADPGCGWAGEVAQLERESQGYDRVRDVFDHPKYMALANYKLFAVDGVKYDLYYLQYDWSHPTGVHGATNGTIEEPYEVIIALKSTEAEAALETLFNTWLAGLGFTTVDVDTDDSGVSSPNIQNA